MENLPIPRDIPLALPADAILLQTLLVLLFLWHILFVNLMVGGSLLTLVFEILGRRRRGFDALAKEIAGTVTVNKSLAVVFGVGPLLAINVLYTVHFYTANALTGAAWIAIVPLVTVAFLITYLHKYTWDRMPKSWHIALGGLGAALFLVIPLIFLANINLMLFPSRWLEVRGFASAFALANAGPRYWHFLTASVAVSALFLLVYFLRAGYPIEKKLPDLTRAGLRRLFYGIALGATCAQLFFGLLVLVTLPRIGLSALLFVVIGVGVTFAATAAVLMGREVIKPADRAMPRGVAVFALITLTAFAMGYGRHIYRENALREHRRLIAAHTADVGWLTAAAQWREATGQGLTAVPLGQKIFESTCAACHAKDRVLVGPSLAEIAGLYAGNPRGIADWTNNPGKKRVGFQQMPAFRLGDEKLAAVAAYVLELGGAAAPAPTDG
jgi:cytochrome c